VGEERKLGAVCVFVRAQKAALPLMKQQAFFFFKANSTRKKRQNLRVSGGRLGVDLGHLLHRIHFTFGTRVVVAEDVQRHPVLLLGALDFFVEFCVVQRQAAVDGERLEGFLVLLRPNKVRVRGENVHELVALKTLAKQEATQTFVFRSLIFSSAGN